MHLKRWITGIVSIPILIYLIGFGPRWLFFGLLCAVSVVGLVEFYRVTASDIPRPVRWSGYLLSLALFFSIYTGKIYFLLAIISLWAFVPMTLFLFAPHSLEPKLTGDIGKGLLGPVYVSLPLSMLMIIDRYPHGNFWIFFLLAVIFASDTGAFYFGKFFGKHKLYQAISPGKTWEGTVGGILSSIFVGLWFLQIFRIHRISLTIISLILGLSIVEQIGDLVESMLKRNHGVKDSGSILPGHGGILDRIDGLIFAIPVLYMYLFLCIV